MVGEATNFQRIVDKPLVQSATDGCEGNVFSACFVSYIIEDVAQSGSLFLAVGKDVELVALQKIVLQSLGEQVEVLVKERLRGDVETDD